MKCFCGWIFAALFAAGVVGGEVLKGEILVDFEGLPVNGDGYYNGDVDAGSPYRDNYSILDSGPGIFGGTEYTQQWTSSGATFSNVYNSDGYWNGWSWSNVQDSTTAGFMNEYASFPGGGSNGLGGIDNGVYAVAYQSGAYFNIPDGFRLRSADFSNTTYAALAMRDGYFVAKKFGGETGNDPDFFRAILTGFDGVGGSGNQVASLQIDLSDYTFADNSLDFILDSWTTVDLTSLGFSKSVVLSFDSSDVGGFGINTPTYVAMDNLTLTAVPEPGVAVAVGSISLLIGYRHVRTRRSRLHSQCADRGN